MPRNGDELYTFLHAGYPTRELQFFYTIEIRPVPRDEGDDKA